ncbi:hypothetical protein [Sediminicoccus rosea]|uniref:Uncharacterized protein n=1 Tax=Sediminicoccus rosea TaxID=1225128 RepID=A0ABZ0PDX7_9PROT|nr:hypothetical protein [Sediminicoccus rosea]WPB83909.1 hypothetical protein R9Z33_17550 [Sediminicoccus rosea]
MERKLSDLIGVIADQLHAPALQKRLHGLTNRSAELEHRLAGADTTVFTTRLERDPLGWDHRSGGSASRNSWIVIP